MAEYFTNVQNYPSTTNNETIYLQTQVEANKKLNNLPSEKAVTNLQRLSNDS